MPSGKMRGSFLTFNFDHSIKIEILHALLAVSMPSILYDFHSSFFLNINAYFRLVDINFGPINIQKSKILCNIQQYS